MLLWWWVGIFGGASAPVMSGGMALAIRVEGQAINGISLTPITSVGD